MTLEEIEAILDKYFKVIIEGGDDGDGEGCTLCGNSNWSFEEINHESDCIVPKLYAELLKTPTR